MHKMWKIVQSHAICKESKKLHLGIQTLITARSLEGTIITYIYSYHEEAIRLEVVPFP